MGSRIDKDTNNDLRVFETVECSSLITLVIAESRKEGCVIIADRRCSKKSSEPGE
jgi:hypothetical protein